jgi:hypothetical protein
MKRSTVGGVTRDAIDLASSCRSFSRMWTVSVVTGLLRAFPVDVTADLRALRVALPRVERAPRMRCKREMQRVLGG